ncbi:uncharacterized protein LOC132800550 [Ziziphus jujuba]|uniref:Uncharacterized protein LOC132800550 n=1 Tax=Ziziphus jujuba TaxID=326968 RepID=A0ABM4A172_ZIZJJ|nr:uncharacterized protein LOC132800550 [Ziziphus jujuba]
MAKRAEFWVNGSEIGYCWIWPNSKAQPRLEHATIQSKAQAQNSGPIEMASGDVPVAQMAKQTPVVQAPLTARHTEIPEKFDGADFKRWQQKMLFYLTILGLARFLTEGTPSSLEESDRETLMAVDVWKNSDYLCRNYVLNGLSDSLYGVYYNAKSAKKLWETLDRKNKTKNGGSGKFVVGRFLDYMMVDTKPLMSQKLPLSWNDFINYLKHKRKEMDMEALVSKLRIEDDNRRSDRRSMKAAVKANVVEHRSSSKSQKKKPGMSSKLGPK